MTIPRRLILTMAMMLCIVTANAADDVRIWSAKRGFIPFCTDGDTICNHSHQKMYRLSDVEVGKNDFEWTSRLCALNNAPDRQYTYIDVSGRKERVIHPAYGLALISADADTLLIELRTRAETADGLLSRKGDDVVARMELRRATGEVAVIDSASISYRQIDLYTGENVLRVNRHKDKVSVYAGKRGLHNVLNAELPGFSISSIGYTLAPGAALRLTYVCLKTEIDYTRYCDLSILDDNTDNNDPLQGYWSMSEFNLESKTLQLGGLYDVAIVPSDDFDGYYLVYLSGADKNTVGWESGMIKGELHKTRIAGVFDTVWIDSDHKPMRNKVRTQTSILDNPCRYDRLTITFPYHDSSVTLCRIR